MQELVWVEVQVVVWMVLGEVQVEVEGHPPRPSPTTCLYSPCTSRT